MKSLFLLSLLVLGVLSNDLNIQLIKDLFQQWKSYHKKDYSPSEEKVRFMTFAQNYLDILEFNEKAESATLALNQFADLTSEEFGSIYTGAFFPGVKENTVSFANDQDLPTSVDWRKEGAVTEVKNQGQCGSCWTFSTTGALESLNFINGSTLTTFSEQQLVDCVSADQGCDGGYPSDALVYTSQNGIETESDYPYTGADGNCDVDASKTQKLNTGYVNVTTQSVDDLKAAIVQQPVSIGIQANQLVFQFYAGGVIKRFCGDTLDHAVLVVGYDTFNGVEAFIVKNSWGASWGNSGYVYISTDGTANNGNGVCGILADPVIPINQN